MEERGGPLDPEGPPPEPGRRGGGRRTGPRTWAPPAAPDPTDDVEGLEPDDAPGAEEPATEIGPLLWTPQDDGDQSVDGEAGVLKVDEKEVTAYAAAFDRALGERVHGLLPHERVEAFEQALRDSAPPSDGDASEDGGEGRPGSGDDDGPDPSEPVRIIIEPHQAPKGLRRHRTSRLEWAGLAVESVAAMAAVAGAGPSPTGWAGIDTFERMLVAVIVVLAGSRARRWALLVAAGCMGAAGAGIGLVAAALALGTSTFLTVVDRRVRLLGGAVGGLVTIAAFTLPAGDGAVGLRWFLALVAIGSIVVAGYRNLRGTDRQRWRRVAIGVAAVVGLSLLAGIVIGLQARGDLTAAIREAGRAVDAVERGDTDAAETHFLLANAAFERAHQRLDSPIFRPLRLLPVVSQNLRAVDGATEVGQDLTSTLGYEVGAVAYDRLSLPDGGIDLDVLASFAEPVANTKEGLDRGSASVDELASPWLVGPVRSRLADLDGDLTAHRREIALANVAIDRAPAVLGGDGTRRYLVMLGNPAEARDLGGHVGNWAELRFRDGHMDLVEVGSPNDLVLPSTDVASKLLRDLPTSLLEMDPLRFPQNWSADPDLPRSARLARRLYAAKTGRTVDGVAYADAETFAAIVGLTGPRNVRGTSPRYRLTEGNAAEFVTSEQYESFPTEQAGNDGVEDLVRAVFDDLTHTKLPGPRRLGDRFSPLVREGRFAFTTFHGEDRPLLRRIGIESRLPDLEGANLIGVVNRNANPSKIDSYLRRRTTASFNWNPRLGEVRGTVDIRLRNLAPKKGRSRVVIGNQFGAPLGTNVTDLTLLTRFELRGVQVDGRPVGVQAQESGKYWRYTVRVTVAPGRTAVVRFRTWGTVTPGAGQRLVVVGQPLVNDNTLSVRVHPTVGQIVPTDEVGVGSSGEAEIDVLDAGDQVVPLIVH